MPLYILADCGDPPAPGNGTVMTPDGTSLEKTAIYECDEGFVISAPVVRICLSTGMWSYIQPTCDPIRKYLQPPPCADPEGGGGKNSKNIKPICSKVLINVKELFFLNIKLFNQFTVLKFYL